MSLKKEITTILFSVNNFVEIFMELFERIRFISKNNKISLAKIAGHLGLSQQNFNQWFNKKAQRRLWEHLPKILELFPDVRPEWLYMGQEPAFRDGTQAEKIPTAEEFAALQEENRMLKEELAETNRLYRKVSARFLVEGQTDEKSAAGTGAAAGQE